MSEARLASVASTTAFVPGGPTIVKGVGVKVDTHRVVITSPRSVMWSLWRCVSRSALRPPARDADGRGAHEDAPTAVDEHGGAAGPHERRGPGPLRVGKGAPGAEEDDLDHEVIPPRPTSARACSISPMCRRPCW